MIKKYLKFSEFTKHVITLVTGTTIAQAIPILISPILTRLFTPEDFGLFGIYFSIASILAIVACGRYEWTIVLPEEDEDSRHIVVLSLIIAFVISSITLIIIILCNDWIIGLLKTPELKNYLYWVPLSIFAMASYEVHNYWLIRKKAFFKASVSKITQTSSEGAAASYLGAIKYSSGLIVGKIVGQIIVILIISKQAIKEGLSYRNISIKRMKQNSKRYSDFPKYGALPALFDKASYHVPILFISMFYATSIVGFFTLIRQAIAGPLGLISTSVSKVLFQRISEKKNKNEKVAKEIVSLTWRLILIVIPALIIIEVFAPEIFAFIWGEQWRVAGDYARILAVLFAVRFVVSPLSIIFPALDAVKMGSLWQMLHFIGVVILYFFNSLTIYNFFIAYVSIEVIIYICYYIMIYTLAKKFDVNLSKKDTME